MQEDWNTAGSEHFAFEIVDELTPRSGEVDYRGELESLENLWLERLQPFGERGYNQPKLSREARLRMIAAKRLQDPD